MRGVRGTHLHAAGDDVIVVDDVPRVRHGHLELAREGVVADAGAAVGVDGDLARGDAEVAGDVERRQLRDGAAEGVAGAQHAHRAAVLRGLE